MSETAERRIFEDILTVLERDGHPPAKDAFRIRHEPHRSTIDRLVENHLLEQHGDQYEPTLRGLHKHFPEGARRVLDLAKELLPHLKDHYRRQQRQALRIDDLAQVSKQSSGEIVLALVALDEVYVSTGWSRNAQGQLEAIHLQEFVLDVEEEALELRASGRRVPPFLFGPFRLARIEVDGYRPFREFRTDLGPLTVLVGANGTGKTSLFSFLRFVRAAVRGPLPPEIDVDSGAIDLFHVGGPERIGFSVHLTPLEEGRQATYSATVSGPMGTPTVARETLTGGAKQRTLLDFMTGKGDVREPGQVARPWQIDRNQLALSRTADPGLSGNAVREHLASLRLYGEFDLKSRSAIRRPVPSEPNPTLDEDASNLSAVLHSMQQEHREEYEELLRLLRTALPTFRSVSARPYGGQGTVIGMLEEEGLRKALTFADVSEGTLRLLLIATLCLNPNTPPLVCFDEPERGLHPRTLPLVAELLQTLSERTQVIVATHSPWLLSHFDLSEIAVMRKEDGRVVCIRPGTSQALAKEVEEFGGEAIARLFLTEEMEILP